MIVNRNNVFLVIEILKRKINRRIFLPVIKKLTF